MTVYCVSLYITFGITYELFVETPLYFAYYVLGALQSPSHLMVRVSCWSIIAIVFVKKLKF